MVELARTLAHHPMVYRVDLLTRLIEDPAVAPDYGLAEERLSEDDGNGSLRGAYIVRVPAGDPKVYLPKEQLWPHIRECAPCHRRLHCVLCIAPPAPLPMVCVLIHGGFRSLL